ncbi:P-loop containing nucleoside triphosphate hydrolase protein, partial [Thelonectria olida]
MLLVEHVLKNVVLVPYNRNQDFIARDAIFDNIKQKLGHGQRKRSANRRSRVSLYGLGGVGKSQIALAYTYWLQETCPDVSVFWVHAAKEERFRLGYASIAQECAIPGHDDPKADLLLLVKTWLEKTHKRRWLMVIDNADETELFFPSHQDRDKTGPSNSKVKEGNLGRYIPVCSHGSILITSRNKQAAFDLAQGKPPIEVGEMTDDEAHRLVRAVLDDSEISTEDTSRLAARLEHLPLAIAQATAFIQRNTISISEYVQLLNEGDAALVDRLSEPFETAGRDSEIPHAVTATWIISFEQLERRHTPTSNVLSVISLFDRQGIPKKFVADYWHRTQAAESGGSEAAEVTKVLGTLKAFSFISEGKDHSVDMHRLVQLVMRKWLFNEKKMAKFAQDALHIVSDAYPFGRFETRELCLKYLPHAQAVLKNGESGERDDEIAKASLLHGMAGYFLYQGRWKEAEELFVRVMELRKRVLGEEHPSTLTSMANLASTYRNQGRWKEAEALQVRVMETRKRVLGEEHPSTLTSMANLASTYWNQGRWKEAEALEVRVMETSSRVLGEEHPSTLTSMANLASTYRNQGRWEEAEDLQAKELGICSRVLGEEHPDTLTSMANLASTYWNQGRWKEAEELQA